MPIDHLPPRLRRPAERLRAAMMTDSTGLVLIGLGCLVRGVGFLTLDPASHPLEVYVAMDVWAVVWLTLATLCLVGARRPDAAAPRWSYACAVGLHVGWGMSLLLAGSWLTASWYWLFAATVAWAVWRGNRLELRIREVRE